MLKHSSKIKTNSYLENLIELTGDSAGAAAVNYIGKEIQMVSNQLNLEDGKASFAYNIAGTAENCTATITDTTGNIVGYIDCDATGNILNQVVWDGKDSQGNQLSDGAYIVNVNAKSSSNQALDVAVVTYGKVGNVCVDGDGCFLGCDGQFFGYFRCYRNL
jgi:flagellar basal-body rod modification protein FlgD